MLKVVEVPVIVSDTVVIPVPDTLQFNTLFVLLLQTLSTVNLVFKGTLAAVHKYEPQVPPKQACIPLLLNSGR